MSKKKFTKKNLIELLIKKAQGFYYTEETLEYEKTQNKTNSIKNQSQNENNLTIFDFCDRVQNEKQNTCDTIKVSNETQQISNKDTQGLTLSKKKVTTHFVSPDMLAIKILFEIYGKEMNENNIENLSDKDLIILKNKLVEELTNENSKKL